MHNSMKLMDLTNQELVWAKAVKAPAKADPMIVGSRMPDFGFLQTRDDCQRQRVDGTGSDSEIAAVQRSLDERPLSVLSTCES